MRSHHRETWSQNQIKYFVHERLSSRFNGERIRQTLECICCGAILSKVNSISEAAWKKPSNLLKIRDKVGFYPTHKRQVLFKNKKYSTAVNIVKKNPHAPFRTLSAVSYSCQSFNSVIEIVLKKKKLFTLQNNNTDWSIQFSRTVGISLLPFWVRTQWFILDGSNLPQMHETTFNLKRQKLKA